jgi:hypothetical protein
MPAEYLRRLTRLESRRAATRLPDLSDPMALAARVGIELDLRQRDVLTTDAAAIALLWARQTGKSTVAALLALYVALSRPGSLTLILSPGERQSKLLFKTVMRFYRRAGHPVPADVENKLSLELANGSEIHALPGSEATVRGFSGVDLLIVDEAARVADDLYNAVRPMLAVSRGRLVLLTTPAGKRGFFWRAWTEGGDGWHRSKATVYDNPRIDPAWIALERAAIGEWWFSQEHLVEFVDTDDQVFASDLIAGSLSKDISPIFPIHGMGVTA